ncbi:MAG TPA: isoamylase early set domain-containing protein [Candidatus Atribacteria bacterium]|nr:isoamylase early set domain-containing protein [Candidatus Atribacteria bacterium]
MDIKEKKLVEYLENLPKVEVSEGFAQQVMYRIEGRKKKHLHYADYKKWVVVSLAAAFLVLIFFSNLPLLPELEISPSLGYRKIELVFYSPSQSSRTVAVAGDFSSWDYLQMERVKEDCWRITLKVKPGKYQYGFLVDGKEWVADPNSLRQVPDGFGKFNSVLVVNGESNS